MARRHGPQLRNLMYDRASAADDLMRSEAADSHQGQEQDRSSNRLNGFTHPVPPVPQNHLAAGGVHRLSYRGITAEDLREMGYLVTEADCPGDPRAGRPLQSDDH